MYNTVTLEVADVRTVKLDPLLTHSDGRKFGKSYLYLVPFSPILSPGQPIKEAVMYPVPPTQSEATAGNSLESENRHDANLVLTEAPGIVVMKTYSAPTEKRLSSWSLQRRHNNRDGMPNHRRLDYLLNRLFRRR